MKPCPERQELKPTSRFGKNCSLGDGLSFYCLECNRSKSNAHYRKGRAALGKQVRDLSWVIDGFRWCPARVQGVPVEDYVRNSAVPSSSGATCKPCHNAHGKVACWVRHHGLSRADVEEIRREHSNRCALCGEPDPGHLDHDHGRGFVRALLCQRCNLPWDSCGTIPGSCVLPPTAWRSTVCGP